MFPKQRPRGSNQPLPCSIIQPYFIPPRLPDGSGASCGTNSPAQPPDVTRGGTGTPKSPVTSVSLRGPPRPGAAARTPAARPQEQPLLCAGPGGVGWEPTLGRFPLPSGFCSNPLVLIVFQSFIFRAGIFQVGALPAEVCLIWRE